MYCKFKTFDEVLILIMEFVQLYINHERTAFGIICYEHPTLMIDIFPLNLGVKKYSKWSIIINPEH